MSSPVSPSQEFWRRAWLRELGVEWRGPLPAPLLPAAHRGAAAAGAAEANANANDATASDETPSGPETAAAAPDAAENHPEPVAESTRSRHPLEATLPEATPAEVTQPEVSQPEATQPEVTPADTERRPAEPMPPVPAQAAPPPQAWRLTGGWRWSWWRGSEAVEQALLLRPADAPRQTDAAARDLLAAAMAAVGLVPVPRDRERPLGGLADRLDEVTLRELASRPWRPLARQPLVVIVCLPPRLEHELSRQTGVAEAAPGGQWLLPGQPGLQLVFLPAPERMLEEGAAAKRVAWQALAPLRQSV